MEHAYWRHLEQGPVALLGAGEARLSLAAGRHIREQRNRTGDAAVFVDVGHIHHRPDFAPDLVAQPQLEGVAPTTGPQALSLAERAQVVRMHEVLEPSSDQVARGSLGQARQGRVHEHDYALGVAGQNRFSREIHQAPIAKFVLGQLELCHRGSPLILVAQLCPDGAHVHLSA